MEHLYAMHWVILAALVFDISCG